jgi:hypothetical protein
MRRETFQLPQFLIDTSLRPTRLHGFEHALFLQ